MILVLRRPGTRLITAAAVLALCLAGPDAWAACTAPVVPDPAGRPVKPVLPERGACVDAKPGTAGCLGWEAYSYNDAVKAFNEKAKAWKSAADAYAAKLNAYVQASNDYARCEVSAMQ